MEPPFRKDLSHLTWDEVYARQELRAPLVPDWLAALKLKAGDHVLEVGAGPGYVSLILADRVGSEGLVYAVDRSAEALAALEQRQTARGVAQIRRLVADVGALDPESLDVDAALVTMVLHHADDPAALLRNVGRILPAGALCVIGEFHPQGPCEVGPPRDHRLAPQTVRDWCEAAGFETLQETRQSPEHYMLVVRRG